MNQLTDTQILIEVAQMYYEKDMTQQQIAKKMNMSRSLVSKLLTKAKKSGIVEVVIHTEFAHPNKEIEDRLKQLFQLQYVRVIDSSNQGYNTLHNEAARYLTMRMSKCKNIVVSSSRTVRKVADAVSVSQTFPNVTFIPMSGGMWELHGQSNANAVCSFFSQKYGAKCQQFYSPVIVDSCSSKEILCAQPFIKNVLENGKKADLAIVGIGSLFQGIELGEAYLQELNIDYKVDEKYVQGNLSFHYFDSDGQPVDCVWNRLVMGLSIDEIKKIPEVICVAEGNEKAKSLYAALKNHIFTSLIIDISIAKRLLFYYSKELY